MLVESLLLVATALFLAVGLRATIAEAFRIPSASMEPQLDIGDRVVVSRLAYHLHDPRRGDASSSVSSGGGGAGSTGTSAGGGVGVGTIATGTLAMKRFRIFAVAC